jgi:exodeoxyribonuclease VII large subunit
MTIEGNTLSVSQYLELVNLALRQVPASDIAIEGEVSDFRVAQGKWVSFDLKDEKEQAVLKCFMTTWQLTSQIEDGMRIRVKGYPKVYERFGTLKLNVQEVEPVGEGALKRAYELLKKKLENEGLFDQARKRLLPRFPSRVGLITSRDAAAYGDFLRVLNNRWGGILIQFVHVHVQGSEAVSEIVNAFEHFNSLTDDDRPEVLVLTRGGGGLEDLHAFNDEQVARAVYASKIPVVCGVGHERDESLCDFVADVRASTPSNAAERVTPTRDGILYEIEMINSHIEERFKNTIQNCLQLMERATHAAGVVLERQTEHLGRLCEMLIMKSDQNLSFLRNRIIATERVLRQVDPKRILARGFSVVKARGKIVKDAASLGVGGEIAVQFSVGCVDAEVLRVDGRGTQKLI